MAGIWASRRLELLRWFQQAAPSLADPYRAAVELIANGSFPARIHLIGHIVRDICNRLPDFLGSARDPLDYSKELKLIAEVWPASATTANTAYSSGGEPFPDNMVLLPKQAVVAVDALLRKHGTGQRNRDVVAKMFALAAEADEAGQEQLRPIVDEFFKTGEWFMHRTHLTAKVTSAPDESELIRKFEQFELITLSLVRSFFTTADELDELIQEANSSAD